MTGKITAIYRYPVKGLSPDPMQSVAVAAGGTLPFDRAWAIENGPSRFDPADPRPVPDISFLILMRDERLATLESRFDEEAQRLTLLRNGRQVASGVLSTPSGRQVIEQFVAAYMADRLRGRPKIVGAPGHSITEGGVNRVHIVNLATVRELERVIGRSVDPIRFRPNLLVDGLPAWAEFDWLGREIEAGAVRLKACERTERCAATNVDPKTGARDMDIPAVMRREFGHHDFGVYAEVLSSGALSVGDPVATPGP
ncbi:MOSC domain-containing protein [Hyphomicrobium sp.]|uniref:MOSC domain-containing protein n=1 Tax=Hyphomicrobium sp. TaxID=82 RepID=UPI002E347692|nr:MOSC domain-containing protein [Hyphomicrobium sp.]HEX2841515.1 MOSC domain-containing protein [Hyphomicrobium sp.]